MGLDPTPKFHGWKLEFQVTLLFKCVAASERHTEKPAWRETPGRKEPTRESERERGQPGRLGLPAPLTQLSQRRGPVCQAVSGSSSWADAASPHTVPSPLPPLGKSPCSALLWHGKVLADRHWGRAGLGPAWSHTQPSPAVAHGSHSLKLTGC